MNVWLAVVAVTAVACVGLAFTTWQLRLESHRAHAHLAAHTELSLHIAATESRVSRPAVELAPKHPSNVSVHTPITGGSVRARCCALRAGHNLVPGESWGSLPEELKSWWQSSRCDELSERCHERDPAPDAAQLGMAGTAAPLAQSRMAGVESACIREPRTTIDGGDIFAGFYNTPTADACCQACNLRPDCLAWSFSGGVCWRKGPGGKHKSRAGAVSGTRCAACGILSEAPPACGSLTPGTTCHTAVTKAIAESRLPTTSRCAYRGHNLLPSDPQHAYQSYVHENVAPSCAPPCFPKDDVNQSTIEAALTLHILSTPPFDSRLLAIGLPSACRESSNLPYLARRLVHHATGGLGPSVRFTAWQSHSAADNAADRAVLEALGFKVDANVGGYPPFAIRRSLGDPYARVRWRSTESLDYSRLLNLTYAQRSKYVLIVQDDTFAAPDLGVHLQTVLEAVERRDPKFGMVSLYTDDHRQRSKDPLFEQPKGPTNPLLYGRAGQAVALLFRRDVVPGLAEFVSRNFMEAPLDWMIYSYIGHLHNGSGLKVYGYTPNLFQHVGWASTARFKNKVQGVRRFTSATFSWMSLAAIEAHIREGKL